MSDVVLTDAMKKRLRGSLGFKVDAKFQYVPKAYRDQENGEFVIPKEFWPVFTLRGVDGVNATLAEDNLHGTVTMHPNDNTSSITVRSGKHKVDTCRRGVITWKNFRDIDGKLLSCPEKDDSTGGVTEESLKVLSPALLAELTNAITERSILTSEELLGLE